jgi:2-polyprenyl-6-methoxyphenol hydroxylase-like FAD-dependent oxidoreductase
MSDPTPQQVAIVGSGICGMWTAMTLARRGHAVTLIERDGPPPDGDAEAAFFDWDRRGAAQFRHPHAFLGLMCNLIETHHPELLAAFYEAGARRMDFADNLPPTLQAGYRYQEGDERLWVLLCRRATMETVIRRQIQAEPGVTIRNHCRVTGLLTEPVDGHLRAAGVALEGDQELRAELTIDASGRTSRFPQWLEALGHGPREEKDDARIVYYTRHYRLNPGREEPLRKGRSGAGDLGYLKFGVFPGDNGHFAIILCLPTRERKLLAAIRDPDGFDAACRAIPGLEPWVSPGTCTPTTEPFGIGDIQSVWREFDDGKGNPLLLDWFAVGDAAVRTNPLYGRGCSLGVLHAQILAEELARESDPVRRAVNFAERTRTELRPIFEASLNEDRRGIRKAEAIEAGEILDRPDSLTHWFRLAFRDALAAAAREDLDVLRGIMRTFHLLETPGAFLSEGAIRRKVLRYMLRGRRRNGASRIVPGPDRREMHALLGARSQAAPA